jgi:hypothetical protein
MLKFWLMAYNVMSEAVLKARLFVQLVKRRLDHPRVGTSQVLQVSFKPRLYLRTKKEDQSGKIAPVIDMNAVHNTSQHLRLRSKILNWMQKSLMDSSKLQLTVNIDSVFQVTMNRSFSSAKLLSIQKLSHLLKNQNSKTVNQSLAGQNTVHGEISSLRIPSEKPLLLGSSSRKTSSTQSRHI